MRAPQGALPDRFTRRRTGRTMAETSNRPHARHRRGARRRGARVAIVGRSPWYLAWRRLRRNYVALGFLGVFIADRHRVRAGAALRDACRAHRPERDAHRRDGQASTARRSRSSAAGGVDPRPATFKCRPVIIVGPTWWHADGRYVLGADNLGRDVDGAAALRRAQLALDRDRLGAHLHLPRGHPRRCSPATTAAGPTGSIVALRST